MLTLSLWGLKRHGVKKIGGVDYRIGWLPFGGYVDIPQIDSTSIPHTDDGKELPPAKPIHRLLSAFAGPFFNILFGFALGCVVWYIGVPQDSPKMREITVQSIDKNGPEYKAGLRKGDRIVKVNGKKFFCTWRKFIFTTILENGPVTLDVKRDGKDMEITYAPQRNPKAPENIRFERMPWPFFQAKIPIKMFPEKDSPAALAGMKKGDIIVSINGRHIENYDEFFGIINYCRGKTLHFVVDRDGKEIKLASMKPVLYKEVMEMLKDVYRIGVAFGPKTAKTASLNVLLVMPSSPAALAGVKPGDIVEKVNDKKVADFDEFSKATQTVESYSLYHAD